MAERKLVAEKAWDKITSLTAEAMKLYVEESNSDLRADAGHIRIIRVLDRGRSLNFDKWCFRPVSSVLWQPIPVKAATASRRKIFFIILWSYRFVICADN